MRRPSEYKPAQYEKERYSTLAAAKYVLRDLRRVSKKDACAVISENHKRGKESHAREGIEPVDSQTFRVSHRVSLATEKILSGAQEGVTRFSLFGEVRSKCRFETKGARK